MNPIIFISWSLPVSQKIAGNIYTLFRKLFPTFSFFISSENISTGQRWYDVISEKLDACNIGLIVVTEENYLRPWIHYEAGALAKVVDKSRVMPIRCGVKASQISETPLSAFQSAELNKAGLRRVANSIREITDYSQIEADFDELFEGLWEKHGPAVLEFPESTSTDGKEPVPAGDDAELRTRLDQVMEIVRSMEARLPQRPLTEADVTRIVASQTSGAIVGQGELATMSLADAMKALGLDEEPSPRNAFAAAPTMTNALAGSMTRPRHGLLNTPPPPPPPPPGRGGR